MWHVVRWVDVRFEVLTVMYVNIQISGDLWSETSILKERTAFLFIV